MPENLAKLLEKARAAYKKGDKRQGAFLLDKILQKDFTHPGAWELLYRKYAAGRSFEVFQEEFVQQFYPDKLHLLHAAPRGEEQEQAEAPATERAGLFARLRAGLAGFFGRFRRKRGQEESEAQAEAETAQLEAGSNAGERKSRPLPTANPSAERPSLLRTAAASNTQPLSAQQPKSQPVRTPPTKSQPVRTPQPEYRSAPPFEPDPAPPPAPRPLPVVRPAGGSSSGRIQVMVVDDTAETRENVIRSLSFNQNIEVVGTAADGNRAIRVAQETQPDVIVMDVNMPDMDGITATTRIRSLLPSTQIIILTVQDDVDYMRKAMRAGARDFLVKPPEIDDLLSAVQRAGEMAKHEKAKEQPVLMTPTTSGKAPAPIITQGKVITVYSPKGGVGCTTVAANLAATLHNDETQVALVDGNLQFGDLIVFFNQQSKNTIAELARHADELDPDIIAEVMVTHPCGIQILAPPRPEMADSITGEQFSALIKYLQRLYSYVIIDTYHQLTDITFAAFDASDLVVLLSTQDIPSLHSTRKFLDLAPLLNIKRQRILLTINQYDKRINISPEKVGQTFQQPVAAVIPTENTVVIPAINRGIPFMLQTESMAKPIAKAMLELSKAVRQQLTVEEKEE